MEDPFLDQMSAFEIVDLQATYWDLANSTITISMSALFAYLLVSQFIVSRISLGQLVTISIVYSVFMLGQIASLASIMQTMFMFQVQIMGLTSTADEANIEVSMILPLTLFAGWVVSILYMVFAWRKK